ncbi:MAG TPA: hypothetical protein VFE24_07900 [Pirellulales bacterium]|jgi:hypothetical protein|nr:hypothetical protein [Pirellulales bacterium]
MAGPVFSGVWSLILVALLGGSVGAPISIPPLPEDPVMSQAAPSDCLWYFSWSGAAEANSKSKNRTEQLFAEPEVKNFCQALNTALKTAIENGAPQDPRGQILAVEGPKLIHHALTHAVTMFISTAQMTPRGPIGQGGIVVGTGEQTEEIKASLEKIETVLLNGAAQPANAKWHKVPQPQPDAQVIEWGFRGKYLVVGFGKGSADDIAARLKGGAVPAWLSDVRKKLPVERVATVHYANVKKIIGMFQPQFGPDAERLLAALGLSEVQEFAAVSGLDGSDCATKIWLPTAGDLTGLLDVLGPEPVKAADLAPIPRDASFAISARVKPARLLAGFVAGLEKVDANAATEFATQLQQVESVLGFKIKEDLLDALGDSWCIYNSPSEGGLLVTGTTLTVPIKDRTRLLKSNEALIKLIQLNALRGAAGLGNRTPRGTSIRETKFKDQTIYYLDVVGEFSPFSVAWCISDKYLIFSLSPQNIRAFLARDAQAGSLADVPRVAEQLKSGHPVLLTYSDTPNVLKTVYPVAQIIVNGLSGMIQREGIDFDGAALPSLAALLKHFDSSVGTLSREKNGLLFTSRQTVGGSGLVGVMFLGTSFFGLRAEQTFQPIPANAIQQDSPAIRRPE